MTNTLLIGWKNETTYGVNAFTTPASDQAYSFGDYLDKHEIPLPGNEIPLTPVYRLGEVLPVNLVEGAKNVQFSLTFCPLHGYPWKWALGSVAGGATAVFKSAKGTTKDLTLPSLTIYVETEFGDHLYIKGCVVESMDFYGDKDLPMQFTLRILGAEVETGTALTNKTLINPTSLAITKAWGWDNTDTALLDAHDVDPFDDPDVGGIQRVFLHVENILKKRFGGSPSKVVQVQKTGEAVVFTFDVASTAATVDNEILKACRALETNDFQYKWASGVYYWILNVNNLKLRSVKGAQKIGSGDPPVYTLSGQASYDSTRTDVDTTYLKNAVAVKISDGSTYA
jgi:hypothetical protein